MLSSTFPLLSIQLYFPMNMGSTVAQKVFSRAGEEITHTALLQYCEPFPHIQHAGKGFHVETGKL